MSPIRYRDFCDVPRIFLAADETGSYLFDCPFDEQLDDYAASFEVFAMPELSEDLLSGSWSDLSRHALRRLGHVPVSEVIFDASRRQEVDLEKVRRALRE